MPDLKISKISYRELKEKPIEVKDDRYGIAAFVTENVRQTLLACPCVQDEKDAAVILLQDGDIVIGRELRFETRVKADEEIVWAHSGCALEVVEEYRKSGAGVLLMTAPSVNDGKAAPVGLGALFTVIRVKLLKKQKWSIFEVPQYVKMVNTRPTFEYVFKFKGGLLNVSTKIGNGLLRILELSNNFKRKKILKKYIVKQEVTVPDWAGKMATNDGHKYMEYHDAKWLQWNLDYNLNGYPQDKQSFYAVYDKQGNPYGFFMTKERFENEAGNIKNIVRGTIVEWATSDNNMLSETDLNLLAIPTFSPHVSRINTITTESTTEKQLKKMGFISHGVIHFGFKSYKKNSYSDGRDQSLWRLRFGCCNTIIY